MPKKKDVKKKRGRKPKSLKIEGDWKDAVTHALKRGKPSAPEAKPKRESP
jgi:hypothetical protein